MNCWIGIDPGKTGAACFLFEDNSVEFVDWPKTNFMGDIYVNFRKAKGSHIIIQAGLEKVSGMPGQSSKSTFSFGENNGAWKMLLAIMRIPYVDPTPQSWQKGCVRKSDSSEPKARAFLAATRMFPQFIPLLKGPKGGIIDGRVDALLIANFIRG